MTIQRLKTWLLAGVWGGHMQQVDREILRRQAKEAADKKAAEAHTAEPMSARERRMAIAKYHNTARVKARAEAVKNGAQEAAE